MDNNNNKKYAQNYDPCNELIEIEIANRLKMAREEANISQQQLAEILGVYRKRISKYESINNEEITILPPAIKMVQISKILNVSLDWLLLGEKKEEHKLETIQKKLSSQESKAIEILIDGLYNRLVS